MTTTTRQGHSLAAIYREQGDWTEVYLDVSNDTGDPPSVNEERRTSIADELARQGAPEADIEAVVDSIGRDSTGVNPRCQFVLVKDGEVILDELLPGLAVEPELVRYGPLPDLTPLLKRVPLEFSYLVVETSRDGGEVRLYGADSPSAKTQEHVQGRTDTLHKPQAGGWRHDRFQNHAEEMWRQNQSQLAEKVDELVRTRSPRRVFVAGDIRARQLLEQEVAEATRSILSLEPTNTRADGSSDQALADRIDTELAQLLADEKERVLEEVRTHEGRGDNVAELTFGGVVAALANAQVETLVIDSDLLRDKQALALGAEPWIATAPEDALNAPVLGTVPAQLALERAALLTDADVWFTDSVFVPDSRDLVALPGGATVAALLRWPTGPAVPGSTTGPEA